MQQEAAQPPFETSPVTLNYVLRSLRRPPHSFSSVLPIAMAFVVMAAVQCRCNAAPSTAPTTQPKITPPSSWVLHDMYIAAFSGFGGGTAKDNNIPPGKLTVLRWYVMESSDLKVEEALVSIKTDDGRWRLAHLYRHPDDINPPVKWRLVMRMDMPLVSHRDFSAQPTAVEVDRFAKDTEWLNLHPEFKVTAGEGD